MHKIYGLAFIDQYDTACIFYVGHTTDIDRRFREHAVNAYNKNHAEYDTYKYQFIRSLDELNIPWSISVLEEQVTHDDDSEYEWILRIARDNEDKSRQFYHGLPLTNMRAGDFVEEMVRDRSISTRQEVGAWRERRRQQREISYIRDQTDTPQNLDAKELARREQRQQIFQDWQSAIRQTPRSEPDCQRYLDMLNNTERQEKIQTETVNLIMRELDLDLERNKLITPSEVETYARDLAILIQLIELQNPRSHALPEAYEKLRHWQKMKKECLTKIEKCS
jgi:hypothetical protein